MLEIMSRIVSNIEDICVAAREMSMSAYKAHVIIEDMSLSVYQGHVITEDVSLPRTCHYQRCVITEMSLLRTCPY